MKWAACLVLLCAAWSAPALARPPVVVELFTAQGCTPCGKANAVAAKLADSPDTIVLTWSVDYWDYTGWKDTFARPEFADRQRVYDRKLGLRDVYTPQVIVAGALQANGATGPAVDRLVADARRSVATPPYMRLIHGTRLAIGPLRWRRGTPPADVWLVRYDPREQTVEVTAGDNRGQTVAQRNVVRQLARLGTWKGKQGLYDLPAAAEEGLATLVIVQAPKGGKILGVFKAEPAS